MTYPEPSTALNSLSPQTRNTGEICTLSDASGRTLECLHYLAGVWSIELRYDLSSPAFRRQPYTGAQSVLEKTTLSNTQNASGTTLASRNESLNISQSGKITLKHETDTIFTSCDQPFAYHQDEIEIFEGLESKEVTDFSTRAPFAPEGKRFKTNMVRFQYPRTEGCILGLPGQCGEANRNGYRFELYNTDQVHHTPSRLPMYQSWPILYQRALEGEGWVALFHDNPSRTFVDLGVFYEDRITFESVTGNTRLYLAYGQTLAEVAGKISQLLGGASLLPLWAFGYQQCRWSYMSASEVESVALELRKEKIPCDAIYFDIDYMEKFKVFTYNKKTFKELDACIKRLKENDFRSVCIIDPGITYDGESAPYEALKEKGKFLTDDTGKPYAGIVWPGDVYFPDFGNEATSNIWARLQAKWLKEFPFDGVWNDMNEPSNFRGANEQISQTLTERGPHRDEYNLYGYYMAKASSEGMKLASPEERPFVITRSGYPGVQRNAIIWHGDNSSWWEHIKLMIETAVAYSLCGAHYTGADVPGFFNNAPDDLAVRFFQAAAFMPLFRGHSWYFSKRKEPYVYGPQAKELIHEAITLRYSLLREWYSQFEFSIRTHTPLLQPVFDRSEKLISDQFLLFSNLLVAPVAIRDQTKKLIYLPEGEWYPLGDTKGKITGDTWMAIDIRPDSIPVYVKAGTVLTRCTPKHNTTSTFRSDENFEIYRASDGTASGYWYSDDGTSLATSAQRYSLHVSKEAEEVIKKPI